MSFICSYYFIVLIFSTGVITVSKSSGNTHGEQLEKANSKTNRNEDLIAQLIQNLYSSNSPEIEIPTKLPYTCTISNLDSTLEQTTKTSVYVPKSNQIQMPTSDVNRKIDDLKRELEMFELIVDHLVKFKNYSNQNLPIRYKRNLLDTNSTYESRNGDTLIAYLQAKIENIKKDLANTTNNNADNDSSDSNSFGKGRQSDAAYSQLPLKPIHQDIFSEIVSKVMDKIIAAIPIVLHKLFTYGFYQFGQVTSYSYNGYGSDIGKVLANLGIFGYLPLILLNVINSLSVVLKFLRQNYLFRTFLLPAFVLLVVSGSVLFLIWWYQIDDYSYHVYNTSVYRTANDTTTN